MQQIFSRERPPRSGAALRLWRWYEREAGHPPCKLEVCRPGRHQRAAGAARYVFNDNILVYDVAATLQLRLADADFDRATGDYHLE
jgi:hypothetical protein